MPLSTHSNELPDFAIDVLLRRNGFSTELPTSGILPARLRELARDAYLEGTKHGVMRAAYKDMQSSELRAQYIASLEQAKALK